MANSLEGNVAYAARYRKGANALRFQEELTEAMAGHGINRRLLTLGGTAASLAGNAHSMVLREVWTGRLEIGRQSLRIRLVALPDGTGTFQSLDQGGVPATAEIRRNGADQISVTVPAIGGRYDGRRTSAGCFEGYWSQGKTDAALTLCRGDMPAASLVPAPLTAAMLADFRREAGIPALAAAAQVGDGPPRSWRSGERSLGSGRPITDDDLWHVGSITKSMTATLVARLADLNLLSWDDTIKDMLSGAVGPMADVWGRVGFKHLLSHRSGLDANLPVNELLEFPRLSSDAREDRIAYCRSALAKAPESAPGESFSYSNSGYVVAAAMIEHRLCEPWESLFLRHVVEPLGLGATGFGAPPENEGPSGHALGLDGALRAYRAPNDPVDNPAVLGPAGSVHMGLAGLLRYLAAHRDRTEFLSPQSWEALHSAPYGGDYALGWMIRPDGALWHNGSNTLWYAEVLIDRRRGVVAAAVANDGRLALTAPVVAQTLVAAAA